MNTSSEKQYSEKILIDQNYLESLLNDISNAQQTIDMEVYIFENDEWGKKVSEALCAASNRGVQIRLLVDGIGTPAWGNELTIQLEQAQIKTKVFHPLPWAGKHLERSSKPNYSLFWKIIYYLLRLNIRNHRKVCIIDKHIVYIGSANIIKDFKIGAKEIAYRDTTVRIENVNTEKLQYAFERAWGRVSIRIRLRNFLTRIDQDNIFLLNYSWRQRRFLKKHLLFRIKQAQHKILITNAFFIPTFFLLKSLIQAGKRGVEVKILLPNKYEFSAISIVTKTFYSILLKSGIKIFEYTPCILHAKSLIIDNYFLVGSSNLNHRSSKHDLEVDTCIQTEISKQFLEKQFLTDLSQSIEIKKEFADNIPFINRLAGHIILIIKYWL